MIEKRGMMIQGYRMRDLDKRHRGHRMHRVYMEHFRERRR